jgi:hypothetical protein
MAHLMRVAYETDHDPFASPGYVGTTTDHGFPPDRSLSTSTVVDVDWSVPGVVWVTFLIKDGQ